MVALNITAGLLLLYGWALATVGSVPPHAKAPALIVTGAVLAGAGFTLLGYTGALAGIGRLFVNALAVNDRVLA